MMKELSRFCFFFILTLDPKMETKCVSFTLPQQFIPKYKNHGNSSEEDLLRTCQCAFFPHTDLTILDNTKVVFMLYRITKMLVICIT